MLVLRWLFVGDHVLISCMKSVSGISPVIRIPFVNNLTSVAQYTSIYLQAAARQPNSSSHTMNKAFPYLQNDELDIQNVSSAVLKQLLVNLPLDYIKRYFM